MVRATGTSWLSIVAPIVLSTQVWAAQVPCPIALGNFGQVLHRTLTAHHEILEADLKHLGEHAAVFSGPIHERVSRGVITPLGPGQVLVHRYVFGGNSLFFYRQRMMSTGEKEAPKFHRLITLEESGPWEDRKISYPIVIPGLQGNSLVLAYTIGDRVSLVDAISGQILQTYTTGGDPVLSIHLTSYYLVAGLSNRLLFFFPQALPVDPAVPHKHQESIGIPGPAEAILQSHFTDELDPYGREVRRAPLTLVVSGSKLFFLGHPTPDFKEGPLIFPTETVTGPITDAHIEDFAVAGSSLDRRLLILRVQKDAITSKVLVLNTVLSKFEPEKPPMHLAAKTIPGLASLPKFLHIQVPNPPQGDKLVLAATTPDIISGVLLRVHPDGRIPRDPLTLDDVRPGTVFTPYHIPR